VVARKKDVIITTKQADGTHLQKHTTFAGSGFYISPEMFQKDYTCKTDIWSLGVALYVLVAGYPVHALQEAFNILQSTKSIEHRSEELRSLPNMPSDMPESFFQMLEMCLTHKHVQRKNAKDVLGCSFLEFHREQYSKSKLISGTKDRYAHFLEYEKYERAVTTLLASMLRKVQLQEVLLGIDNFIDNHHTVEHARNLTPADYERHANHKKLQIITISELRNVLSQLQFYEVISMMDKIPSNASYGEYAYHIALLRQFITYEDEGTILNSNKNTNTRKNSELDSSITKKWKKVISIRTKFNKNNSTKSNESTNKTDSTIQEISDDTFDHSVHGAKVWDQKKKNKESGMMGGTGMNKSMAASGGMRRNFSTPVLTDLSAYPS